MKKLYPLFPLFLVACTYPKLDEEKYHLDRNLKNLQWLNTYDSLAAKTLKHYKTVSKNWKDPGSVSFGWKDSTWHFLYGLARTNFIIDKLYKINSGQIILDDSKL